MHVHEDELSFRPPARTGKTCFRNAPFLLAITGYSFLYISISLFFLLPLFLGGFGPSRRQIGLIMGINSLVAIFVRPIFGRIIDRNGGRKIALLGVFVLMAVVPTFHLVKDAGWLPMLLNAFFGLGWGISMTASIAVCSDHSPTDRIAHSMGIIGVAGLVANALGPWAGEKIIDRFGFGGLFNVSLVLLVCATICLLLTKEEPRTEAASGRSAPGVLRSIPPFTLIIVAAMPILHGSVRGAMIYFIAVFAKSIGIKSIGPFFLCFSLAAILTRFVTGDASDKHGRKIVILPAALIIAANLVFLSQARTLPALMVGGFIGGFGQGLIYPALNAYLIDLLGLENKGLAISLYLSLYDVGMGLGLPFYGLLADLSGYRMMYIFAAVLLTLATIVFMIKAPATDGLAKTKKE